MAGRLLVVVVLGIAFVLMPPDLDRVPDRSDLSARPKLHCRAGDVATSSNPLYAAGSGPASFSSSAAIVARHEPMRPRRLDVAAWRQTPNRHDGWFYVLRSPRERRVIAVMSVYRIGEGWRGGAMSFCGEYANLIGA